MKILRRTADSNGTIKNAVGRGVGFMLEPAGDSPGSFPVSVVFDRGQGDTLEISSSRAFFLAPFESFEITGAAASSEWNIYILESRAEDIGTANAKTRRVRQLVAPKLMNLGDASGASGGYAVLPSYKAFNVYVEHLSGTVVLAIWVQSVSGTWRLVEQIEGSGANDFAVSRLVDFGGGRIDWRLVTGEARVEVDVELEVG